MKAVVWHGRRDVRVDTVPDPTIEQPTDAIVRITSTGLCGSDLHLYEVMGPFMTEGDILGHEPMGIVEAVGSAVHHIAPGDRVVIPFNISCGHCRMCTAGLQSQCETTQVREYRKGAALFGYTKLYGQVAGGQAELLRVPQAQYGPIKVPDGPPDDRFVYLSDVLPTAWQAVPYAALPPGGTVVILGLGPIGSMAARVAAHLGAAKVIGVDLVAARLERARLHGADVLDLGDFDDDQTQIADAIRDITGGGPDAVIDAVGMEAHGSGGAKLAQAMAALLPDKIAEKVMEHTGVDRLAALQLAIDVVRRGGTISLSGVYGGMSDPLPMMVLFDKQIQLRMGQANVKRWIGDLLPLLEGDDVLHVEDFASHHLPLDDAPHAYEIFQKKQDEAVKILFNPGTVGRVAARGPVRRDVVDIGYFLSSEEHDPTSLVRQAQMAQDTGLERAWISDHFHPWLDEQGQSPFVWSVIGAIAASTSLHVATAVTCPTVRIHPAIVAQAAATSAMLLEGRFELGVGSGEALNEHIFGDRWPPADVRLAMLEEAIELIRRLWKGDEVTHRGEDYVVEDARLHSLPAIPPAILVSGFGPKAVDLAARIGDGYVNTSPDADLVAQFRGAGGRGLVSGAVKVCWGADADACAELAHRLWRSSGVPGELSQELRVPALFEQASSSVTVAATRAATACGPSLEGIIEAVRPYVDAGFDRVYINQIGPEQAAFFAFYAKELGPALAAVFGS